MVSCLGLLLLALGPCPYRGSRCPVMCTWAVPVSRCALGLCLSRDVHLGCARELALALLWFSRSALARALGPRVVYWRVYLDLASGVFVLARGLRDVQLHVQLGFSLRTGTCAWASLFKWRLSLPPYNQKQAALSFWVCFWVVCISGGLRLSEFGVGTSRGAFAV